jgi:ribonuclease HII
MIRPNFQEEKKIWKKGIKRVAGLDEAGRGPLAGPVVAGAVVLDFKLKIKDLKLLKEVNDSKKLSAKKREELYEVIIKNKNIKWGIGVVSEKIIDKINILEATKLAMTKAVGNLKIKPDFLILDGKMRISLPIFQKSIIKGDAKVFSIAAASILAKVYRDRIMQKYHKKYPQYLFDLHKGYGTKLHMNMLKKHGPCQIHRKSFAPVKFYSKMMQ